MKKEAHTMNEKTLTSEQRATLIAYILMTTKMREEEAAATVGRKIFCGKSGKTFCDTRTSRFSRRMNSSTQNL